MHYFLLKQFKFAAMYKKLITLIIWDQEKNSETKCRHEDQCPAKKNEEGKNKNEIQTIANRTTR